MTKFEKPNIDQVGAAGRRPSFDLGSLILPAKYRERVKRNAHCQVAGCMSRMADRSCSCRSGCLQSCRTIIMQYGSKIVSCFNSWLGRHCIFFITGVITIASLLDNWFIAEKITDAAKGPTIWTMACALLLASSSSLSLLRYMRSGNLTDDPHFRRAVLVKSCQFLAKSVLLSFPERDGRVDMRWQ